MEALIPANPRCQLAHTPPRHRQPYCCPTAPQTPHGRNAPRPRRLDAMGAFCILSAYPVQKEKLWETRLREEGLNELEFMQLDGWSTIAMVRRYAKVNVVKLSPKVRKAFANRPAGSGRTPPYPACA